MDNEKLIEKFKEVNLYLNAYCSDEIKISKIKSVVNSVLHPSDYKKIVLNFGKHGELKTIDFIKFNDENMFYEDYTNIKILDDRFLSLYDYTKIMNNRTKTNRNKLKEIFKRYDKNLNNFLKEHKLEYCSRCGYREDNMEILNKCPICRKIINEKE